MSFKETEIGLIPNDWELKKLIDEVVITMGQSPKSEFYNTTSEGVPFMQGRTTFGEKFHSIDTWCTDPKRFAQKNDVLMSVRAPVGDVNIATRDLCIGRGLCSLRMENGNNEYLYYLLKNYIDIIISKESGTVFGSINKTSIETLKLPFPSSKEQKAIAHILSTLDEKIEVNNQINKTLENIAQTIFKQWFVDFEFPNGDGEPYKSSGGEMVESELGMIPKGWEVSNFDKVIKITSGKRPKEREEVKQNNHIYPLVGASSIMGYTTEYNFDEEIIVIGRVGTHGIIQRFKDKIWASDNTLVIKSIFIEYTNQILKIIDYKSLNRGSTQPLITQTDIKNHKIIFPCESILNKYEEIVSVNSEMIDMKNTENQRLKELRDSLLPKLMSGEIRVPIEEN
ncbi:type I restriction enzyme S subunit [Acetoanaerobium pronyense]|uniref:Type I restriction enzyme S subunit n=1 Tax=Acetoanaerobium pronyense TaxID=1482736 RepID=A0ABS4KLX3_9FIRM|nr:restriction endonuclease subunit S [Acetoanaerobium pronyense]MBP2028760.1 type I restriction enzyme S subunit [Acetoanaerobium pronyense]